MCCPQFHLQDSSGIQTSLEFAEWQPGLSRISMLALDSVLITGPSCYMGTVDTRGCRIRAPPRVLLTAQLLIGANEPSPQGRCTGALPADLLSLCPRPSIYRAPDPAEPHCSPILGLVSCGSRKEPRSFTFPKLGKWEDNDKSVLLMEDGVVSVFYTWAFQNEH
jgi:hypothetical protein